MGSKDRVRRTEWEQGHPECPLESHRRGAVVTQATGTVMASSQMFNRGVTGSVCLGSKPRANSCHLGDLNYNKAFTSQGYGEKWMSSLT